MNINNDNIFHLDDAMPKWLIPKKSDKPIVKDGPASPLGWSVGVRLIWVAGASAVLWPSVA
jgi:hypothetical protein